MIPILRSAFPPLRRPLTFWRVAPLLIFLIIFLGSVLLLEWRGILRFSSPIWFFLSLAFPWVWWMQETGWSGLSGCRALASLETRLVLLGVFVLVMAEPRAVRKHEALSVVYALDLSDSIGEKAADAALGYVLRTAEQKPQKDEAGLVVLGRESAVELPPREGTFKFEAFATRIAKDATNLEKGLSLTAAIIPDENMGRIVLISDGNATEGNLSASLDELKSRGIPVDVLPIQYNYPQEVWLEKLDLPKTVKMGETYEATVILSSLQNGQGKLVLRENGKIIASHEVTFQAGKNRFSLPLYLREPGYYEYTATIEVPSGKDGWKENNTAINYLYLKGEGKVLVVTSTDLASDPHDTDAFNQALRDAKRVVEEKTAYEFPRDPLSLIPYDCIVFANVAADAFDAVQLQALRDTVYNQGTGFLMVGGPNSFGPGGYHRTVIEEALPVDMDVTQKKVLPKGALVILLHTCEFPDGNTWAKRITKEAIRLLGAQDDVGALDYDWQKNGYAWIFPLTPAREFNNLVALLNAANPGDMPDFQTPMQMAFNALKANDASAKHMIIISDGDPSLPTPQLLAQFKDEKISVSTVSIYPHGGMEVTSMQAIANETGGRYYHTMNPEQLPAIFIKEAKTLKRSMIQEKRFTPLPESSSPILKGMSRVPDLLGYVLTTPKPRATTLLKGPEQDQIDPVLAVWRFGVGKTAAFTGDLSPKWGREWVSWEQYQAFIKQLMTDISRIQTESDLYLRTFQEGENGVIVIEDHAPQEAFLEVDALVAGPLNRTETVHLRQIGPRRYQAQLPLWGKGRYQVIAAGTGGGRKERASGGFAVAYSPEYLKFRSSPMVLAQIAEKTGGRVLTGNEKSEDIFLKERRPKETTRPIFDWFLFALTGLLLLDVGVRRIQLDWGVIRGWFGGRKKESTVTLSTLLQRKQELTTHREGESSKPLPMPVFPTRQPRTETTPTPPRPAAPTPEAKPEESESLSTTERLLAAKKKRTKDNPEKSGSPET